MATTPMPGPGVNRDPNRIDPAQAQPTSPAFWGRRRENVAPVLPVSRGPQPYPRMMYHEKPEWRAKNGMPIFQVAETEEDHKEALANGWLNEPTLIHREMLQHGDGGRSGNRLAISETEPEAETVKEAKKK